MLHRCLPAFHRRAAVLQHLVSLHSITATCSFSSKRHRPASQGGPGPSYPVERAIAPQSRRRQQQAAAQAASAPRRGRRQQAPHSKPEASPAVDITEHELALFEFIKAALRAAPDVRSFTVRVAGDWVARKLCPDWPATTDPNVLALIITGVNVETFVTAITNHKAALKLPDVPHPLVTTTSAHLQVDALGFTLLPTLLPAAVLHPVHKSQWPVRVTRRHTEHLTRQQSSNLLNLRLVQRAIEWDLTLHGTFFNLATMRLEDPVGGAGDLEAKVVRPAVIGEARDLRRACAFAAKWPAPEPQAASTQYSAVPVPFHAGDLATQLPEAGEGKAGITDRQVAYTQRWVSGDPLRVLAALAHVCRIPGAKLHGAVPLALGVDWGKQQGTTPPAAAAVVSASAVVREAVVLAPRSGVAQATKETWCAKEQAVRHLCLLHALRLRQMVFPDIQAVKLQITKAHLLLGIERVHAVLHHLDHAEGSAHTLVYAALLSTLLPPPPAASPHAWGRSFSRLLAPEPHSAGQVASAVLEWRAMATQPWHLAWVTSWITDTLGWESQDAASVTQALSAMETLPDVPFLSEPSTADALRLITREPLQWSVWLSCAGRQWRHLLTAAVLLRAIASVQQPQLPQTLTLQGVLLESDAASGDGGAEYSPQLAAHVDQLHAAAMEVADDGAAAWPAVAEECGEAAVQAAVAFVGAIEEAGLYDLATTPVARGGDIVQRAPLAGGGLAEQGQRHGDLSRALAMAQAWPMLEWGGYVAGGVDGFWRWLMMMEKSSS